MGTVKQTSSPYAGLPKARYWRSAIADQNCLRFPDLYRKRFALSKTDAVATAGSCFAQHIARNLRANGYRVLDVEPAPQNVSAELAQAYGYSVYSARYGNIYLARQLLQLVREAFGDWRPENWIWTKEGKYYDALRPSVEPDGLDSEEEVRIHRRQHLDNVRKLLDSVDVFVFTFGLTEGWVDKRSGTVFPTAPGTLAGDYADGTVEFKNFTYDEILADFEEARQLLKSKRPNMKFIVTVSPVPLTATATENNVLVASTYSKSVLRAVTGALYDKHGDIDYFPSYELVAAHVSRGVFFDNNLRTVANAGVETVMKYFFDQHGDISTAGAAAGDRAGPPGAGENSGYDEVVCEEQLLEIFAR